MNWLVELKGSKATLPIQLIFSFFFNDIMYVCITSLKFFKAKVRRDDALILVYWVKMLTVVNSVKIWVFVIFIILFFAV